MFDWLEFDKSIKKGFEEQAAQLNSYLSKRMREPWHDKKKQISGRGISAGKELVNEKSFSFYSDSTYHNITFDWLWRDKSGTEQY